MCLGRSLHSHRLTYLKKCASIRVLVFMHIYSCVYQDIYIEAGTYGDVMKLCASHGYLNDNMRNSTISYRYVCVRCV